MLICFVIITISLMHIYVKTFMNARREGGRDFVCFCHSNQQKILVNPTSRFLEAVNNSDETYTRNIAKRYNFPS